MKRPLQCEKTSTVPRWRGRSPVETAYYCTLLVCMSQWNQLSTGVAKRRVLLGYTRRRHSTVFIKFHPLHYVQSCVTNSKTTLTDFACHKTQLVRSFWFPVPGKQLRKHAVCSRHQRLPLILCLTNAVCIHKWRDHCKRNIALDSLVHNDVFRVSNQGTHFKS